MDDYDGLFADLGVGPGNGVDLPPSTTGPPSTTDPSAPSSAAPHPPVAPPSPSRPPNDLHHAPSSSLHPTDPPTTTTTSSANPDAAGGGGSGDATLQALVEEFRLMPLVRVVLERVRDGADAGEVREAVAALDVRVGKVEEWLDGVSGGGMSVQEQVELLGKLERKLERKRALIARYREMEVLTLPAQMGTE